MARQEMTHSPAYYQCQDWVTTVDPHGAYPSSPPAAYLPSKEQQLSLTNPYTVYRSPASQASSPEAHSTLSESSRESYLSTKNLAEPVQPKPGYLPAPFMLSPDAENGSISNLTPSSNGHARKESSNRSSWREQRSYVSGEVTRHSGPHVQSRGSVYAGIDEEPVKSDGSRNALLLLLHMSTSVPTLSLVTCLYTMFSVVFVTLSSPLRLCPPTPFFKSTSFSTQLCQLLVPALHMHERIMRPRKSGQRRRSSQGLHSNDPYRSAPLPLTDSYYAANIVYVLLLAPFLCLGLELAAWTAAFFWVFTMMMGNPDGTERKDDGRAAVLGVANWWRKWLRRARKAS
ncbi:hypothetical protein DTO169E5_737 [Paecilomyces variotii]|nr:hypothetical protein DTO169E5_737 [Paecilomyces variotii]